MKDYVMGTPNLMEWISHKPLLRIYKQNRSLTDIENNRLHIFIGQATQMKFTTKHISGLKNKLAD